MKSSYVNKPVPFKCQSLPQYNWAINFKLEGCARNRKLTKTREEARKEYKKLMNRMNVSKVDCGIADDLTIKSMDKIIALSKKVDMMPPTLLEEYLNIKNNLGVDDLAGFLKRYLQHASRVNHELTLKDASEIFIESIQDRSRRYINCTRQCTMSMRRYFKDDMRMIDITPVMINDWLQSGSLSDVSKYNYAASMSVFFNYFICRYPILATNPAIACRYMLKKPVIIPEIYNIGDAEKIVCSLKKEDRLLGKYVCVGLFSGIRASEMARIKWQNINLDEQYMMLPANLTKSSHRRSIHIPENLVKSLEMYYSSDKDELVMKGRPYMHIRRLFLDHLKNHGVKMARNGLRRSCASYLLAKTRDITYTASQLGHKVHILKKHYLGLVSQSDSLTYFTLTPNN